jgi:hypothetical protein
MGSMGTLGMPTDLMLIIVTYVVMPILFVGFIVLVEGAKPVGAV